MNKKEVFELKRRFRKEDATFTRLCGCYIDASRSKVCQFGGKFLNLADEEFYKYLEIAGKALSGTLGNNLLELHFPREEEEVGGRQQILMALRDCKLEDDNLLNAFYDHVIDTYDYTGNYLILLYHDAYDVMTRTTDNQKLDESAEIFEYLICAICPVALSKPGLGYREDEQRIGSRIRDWVVGAVDTAFLFPAFSDRSTDIHSTLFYTKNTKEPHAEFMKNGLGCDPERTATEQKMAFHSIVRNVLGPEDERTDDMLISLQQNLNDMIEEYEELHENTEEPLMLDSAAMEKLLTDCDIPEDKAARIEKSCNEIFGDKPPVAGHVIDSRALEQNAVRLEKLELEDQVGALTKQLDEQAVKLEEANTRLDEQATKLKEASAQLDTYEAEIKAYDVILHVKPEKASQIKSQVIGGRKCLVIPMEENEHAAINGVNTIV